MLSEARAAEASSVIVSPENEWYVRAMERLVGVITELSHARKFEEVMSIVRRAARELTGADGATFVLRDNGYCYYAEENAIAPLWKGKRFPLETCISGWSMINGQPAVIDDIYKDARIPHDAYRPTFVKSLAMVPIRREQPIGAIGNYWAAKRQPTQAEVSILQALADVTSVAIENSDLYAQLQGKIRALEESNYELARFAWSASHDLKSPLRAIENLTTWLEEDAGDKLEGTSRGYLVTLRQRVKRMEKLLDDILDLACVEKKLKPGSEEIIPGDQLIEGALAVVNVPPGFRIQAGEEFKKLQLPRMPLQRVFSNLVDNAVKHHDKKEGIVRIDVQEEYSRYIFSVADDGPGIAPAYHGKIFEMFQTLKPRDVTEGSGMGLAIVRKTLSVYGGDIAVDSGAGRGTVFRLSWPKPVGKAAAP